jgi:hypothetical protein
VTGRGRDPTTDTEPNSDHPYALTIRAEHQVRPYHLGETALYHSTALHTLTGRDSPFQARRMPNEVLPFSSFVIHTWTKQQLPRHDVEFRFIEILFRYDPQECRSAGEGRIRGIVRKGILWLRPWLTHPRHDRRLLHSRDDPRRGF